MALRTWLITGVSSGFGRELTEQLLEHGERVVGTVRRAEAVSDLAERYPDHFRSELLDVTDTAQIREVAERAFAELGRIDVVVNNARLRPIRRSRGALRRAGRAHHRHQPGRLDPAHPRRLAASTDFPPGE
jgi:NAD(P)-dependent dehydrogenase (short-subunit alcohol dehydrogenase family)